MNLRDKMQDVTGATFELVKNYDVLTKDVEEFVQLIIDLWDTNYGSATYENGILELHTGGWSENEEVYSAIRQNFMFMSGYWTLELHGGHYWFVIKDKFRTPKITWEKMKNHEKKG